MQRYRHHPQATSRVPHVHAPAPTAPDVPTVPRGAGFPILDDTVLQAEGVPLERLQVRVSEAARRARMGSSPYAPAPETSAQPERTAPERRPWSSRLGVRVPRRTRHGAHAAA